MNAEHKRAMKEINKPLENNVECKMEEQNEIHFTESKTEWANMQNMHRFLISVQ